MNTNQQNFILFAGHTGHFFFPFTAASWDDADKVAVSKGWVVDDHMVDANDRNIVSVVPLSAIKQKLAPVVPIR